MSEIKLFNTKSRSLEIFKPITEGSVNLYTCGPTVYNSLHIGNWLAYIRWDTLVRTFLINNYKVNRVMNITDVGHLVGDGDEGEDKLEAGAKRENSNAWQIAERYTNEFLQGMNQLNLLPPTTYAKATDYIMEQIDLIKKLESKNAIYKINDGIYFDTAKFPQYADFAGLDLNHQEVGARVEVNPEKRQPWDFALWKFSPQDKKRDMEWDSPWGKGFPGWHIECSAIAMRFLGETLDIHTGGIDHISVHHTNEIAQSETVTGKTFSNYWLHNNFLLIDDTKISKSLDNGLTIEDLAQKGYTCYDFKMMALQSHYRTEPRFSWEVLESAKTRLKQLKSFTVLRFQPNQNASLLDERYFSDQIKKITECLNNDLSTPAALVILSETIGRVFEYGQGIQPNKGLQEFEKFIKFIDAAFGLDLFSVPNISSAQEKLLIDRNNARAENNWAKSDKLRGQLSELGIDIDDTSYGQLWKWN